MADSFFYIDSDRQDFLSWEDLTSLSDIVFPFYYPEKDSGFIKNLFHSLFFNKDICILDYSLSKEEVLSFVESEESIESKYLVTPAKVTVDQLLKGVLQSTSEITLFTSGTTGKPKKVVHKAKNFYKNARIKEENLHNCWGLCYNPTHMAGLQVIFQAFFNHNKLLNLFNKQDQFIHEQLNNGEISHLSATPTWFRLLSNPQSPYENIKQITLGGEKSDENLHARLKKTFPKARLLNIYASTEAGTIFISEGEFFEVHPSKIGKVKIEENFIWLHTSLLGQSTQFDQTEWYCTGDIVEIFSQSPLKFRFLGREDDMVNVGGNKVNILEVEEIILQNTAVVNARIIVKKNAITGNILVAEVQKKSDDNTTESELMAWISEKLQPYKVPRMIKFVPAISMTRTGKINRQ